MEAAEAREATSRPAPGSSEGAIRAPRGRAWIGNHIPNRTNSTCGRVWRSQAPTPPCPTTTPPCSRRGGGRPPRVARTEQTTATPHATPNRNHPHARSEPQTQGAIRPHQCHRPGTQTSQHPRLRPCRPADPNTSTARPTSNGTTTPARIANHQRARVFNRPSAIVVLTRGTPGKCTHAIAIRSVPVRHARGTSPRAAHEPLRCTDPHSRTVGT